MNDFETEEIFVLLCLSSTTIVRLRYLCDFLPISKEGAGWLRTQATSASRSLPPLWKFVDHLGPAGLHTLWQHKLGEFSLYATFSFSPGERVASTANTGCNYGPPTKISAMAPENNCGHPANLSEPCLWANPLRLAGLPLITQGVVSGKVASQAHVTLWTNPMPGLKQTTLCLCLSQPCSAPLQAIRSIMTQGRIDCRSRRRRLAGVETRATHE